MKYTRNKVKSEDEILPKRNYKIVIDTANHQHLSQQCNKLDLTHIERNISRKSFHSCDDNLLQNKNCLNKLDNIYRQKNKNTLTTSYDFSVSNNEDSEIGINSYNYNSNHRNYNIANIHNQTLHNYQNNKIRSNTARLNSYSIKIHPSKLVTYDLSESKSKIHTVFNNSSNNSYVLTDTLRKEDSNSKITCQGKTCRSNEKLRKKYYKLVENEANMNMRSTSYISNLVENEENSLNTYNLITQNNTVKKNNDKMNIDNRKKTFSSTFNNQYDISNISYINSQKGSINNTNFTISTQPINLKKNNNVHFSIDNTYSNNLRLNTFNDTNDIDPSSIMITPTNLQNSNDILHNTQRNNYNVKQNKELWKESKNTINCFSDNYRDTRYKQMNNNFNSLNTNNTENNRENISSQDQINNRLNSEILNNSTTVGRPLVIKVNSKTNSEYSLNPTQSIKSLRNINRNSSNINSNEKKSIGKVLYSNNLDNISDNYINEEGETYELIDGDLSDDNVNKGSIYISQHINKMTINPENMIKTNNNNNDINLIYSNSSDNNLLTFNKESDYNINYSPMEIKSSDNNAFNHENNMSIKDNRSTNFHNYNTKTPYFTLNRDNNNDYSESKHQSLTGKDLPTLEPNNALNMPINNKFNNTNSENKQLENQNGYTENKELYNIISFYYLISNQYFEEIHHKHYNNLCQEYKLNDQYLQELVYENTLKEFYISINTEKINLVFYRNILIKLNNFLFSYSSLTDSIPNQEQLQIHNSLIEQENYNLGLYNNDTIDSNYPIKNNKEDDVNKNMNITSRSVNTNSIYYGQFTPRDEYLVNRASSVENNNTIDSDDNIRNYDDNILFSQQGKTNIYFFNILKFISYHDQNIISDFLKLELSSAALVKNIIGFVNISIMEYLNIDKDLNLEAINLEIENIEDMQITPFYKEYIILKILDYLKAHFYLKFYFKSNLGLQKYSGRSVNNKSTAQNINNLSYYSFNRNRDFNNNTITCSSNNIEKSKEQIVKERILRNQVVNSSIFVDNNYYLVVRNSRELEKDASDHNLLLPQNRKISEITDSETFISNNIQINTRKVSENRQSRSSNNYKSSSRSGSNNSRERQVKFEILDDNNRKNSHSSDRNRYSYGIINSQENNQNPKQQNYGFNEIQEEPSQEYDSVYISSTKKVVNHSSNKKFSYKKEISTQEFNIEENENSEVNETNDDHELDNNDNYNDLNNRSSIHDNKEKNNDYSLDTSNINIDLGEYDQTDQEYIYNLNKGGKVDLSLGAKVIKSAHLVKRNELNINSITNQIKFEDDNPSTTFFERARKSQSYRSAINTQSLLNPKVKKNSPDKEEEDDEIMEYSLEEESETVELSVQVINKAQEISFSLSVKTVQNWWRMKLKQFRFLNYNICKIQGYVKGILYRRDLYTVLMKIQTSLFLAKIISKKMITSSNIRDSFNAIRQEAYERFYIARVIYLQRFFRRYLFEKHLNFLEIIYYRAYLRRFFYNLNSQSLLFKLLDLKIKATRSTAFYYWKNKIKRISKKDYLDNLENINKNNQELISLIKEIANNKEVSHSKQNSIFRMIESPISETIIRNNLSTNLKGNLNYVLSKTTSDFQIESTNYNNYENKNFIESISKGNKIDSSSQDNKNIISFHSFRADRASLNSITHTHNTFTQSHDKINNILLEIDDNNNYNATLERKIIYKNSDKKINSNLINIISQSEISLDNDNNKNILNPDLHNCIVRKESDKDPVNKIKIIDNYDFEKERDNEHGNNRFILEHTFSLNSNKIKTSSICYEENQDNKDNTNNYIEEKFKVNNNIEDYNNSLNTSKKINDSLNYSDKIVSKNLILRENINFDDDFDKDNQNEDNNLIVENKEDLKIEDSQNYTKHDEFSHNAIANNINNQKELRVSEEDSMISSKKTVTFSILSNIVARKFNKTNKKNSKLLYKSFNAIIYYLKQLFFINKQKKASIYRIRNIMSIKRNSLLRKLLCRWFSYNKLIKQQNKILINNLSCVFLKTIKKNSNQIVYDIFYDWCKKYTQGKLILFTQRYLDIFKKDIKRIVISCIYKRIQVNMKIKKSLEEFISKKENIIVSSKKKAFKIWLRIQYSQLKQESLVLPNINILLEAQKQDTFNLESIPITTKDNDVFIKKEINLVLENTEFCIEKKKEPRNSLEIENTDIEIINVCKVVEHPNVIDNIKNVDDDKLLRANIIKDKDYFNVNNDHISNQEIEKKNNVKIIANKYKIKYDRNNDTKLTNNNKTNNINNKPNDRHESVNSLNKNINNYENNETDNNTTIENLHQLNAGPKLKTNYFENKALNNKDYYNHAIQANKKSIIDSNRSENKENITWSIASFPNNVLEEHHSLNNPDIKREKDNQHSSFNLLSHNMSNYSKSRLNKPSNLKCITQVPHKLKNSLINRLGAFQEYRSLNKIESNNHSYSNNKNKASFEMILSFNNEEDLNINSDNKIRGAYKTHIIPNYSNSINSKVNNDYYDYNQQLNINHLTLLENCNKKKYNDECIITENKTIWLIENVNNMEIKSAVKLTNKETQITPLIIHKSNFSIGNIEKEQIINIETNITKEEENNNSINNLNKMLVYNKKNHNRYFSICTYKSNKNNLSHNYNETKYNQIETQTYSVPVIYELSNEVNYEITSKNVLYSNFSNKNRIYKSFSLLKRRLSEFFLYKLKNEAKRRALIKLVYTLRVNGSLRHSFFFLENMFIE